MTAESKISRAGKQSLEERLAQHPELKPKIESLLSVVENAGGELTRAEEAEQKVIEEVRLLGRAALAEWADKSHEAARDRFIQENDKAHRSRKKSSTGTVA